jgi:AraC-like DNA-binding protein
MSGLSASDQMEKPVPSSDTRTTAACVNYADVFQSPMLETPPPTGCSTDLRRQHAALERLAEEVCGSCPLRASCLYEAVVDHDVAGYVAGTTARQRHKIRDLLTIRVEPEDFDSIAGVTGRHRQVDHDEVVRLRHANPHESLERLARRLGCSLSTVKRHLRQERATGSVRGIRTMTAPSMSDVLAAAAMIRRRNSVRQPAAA